MRPPRCRGRDEARPARTYIKVGATGFEPVTPSVSKYPGVWPSFAGFLRKSRHFHSFYPQKCYLQGCAKTHENCVVLRAFRENSREREPKRKWFASLAFPLCSLN